MFLCFTVCFCGCVFWVTFYWSIQLPVCLINLLPYLLTDRCRSIDVATVAAARRNGTMYAHVYVLPTTALSPRSSDWVITQTVPLTKHELPQASTFQLIGDSADSTVCWRLQSCLCVVQIIYCKLMFRGSVCRFIGNFLKSDYLEKLAATSGVWRWLGVNGCIIFIILMCYYMNMFIIVTHVV